VVPTYFWGFSDKGCFFFCGEIERWGKGMFHEEGWLLGVVVKQVANISGFEHI
jgi:hypothetical protein